MWYVVGYQYGDIYRNRWLPFSIHRQERRANQMAGKLTRRFERSYRGYLGNMHADTSHFDHEVFVFGSKESFEKFANQGWEVNWKERKIRAK